MQQAIWLPEPNEASKKVSFYIEMLVQNLSEENVSVSSQFSSIGRMKDTTEKDEQLGAYLVVVVDGVISLFEVKFCVDVRL